MKRARQIFTRSTIVTLILAVATLLWMRHRTQMLNQENLTAGEVQQIPPDSTGINEKALRQKAVELFSQMEELGGMKDATPDARLAALSLLWRLSDSELARLCQLAINGDIVASSWIKRSLLTRWAIIDPKAAMLCCEEATEDADYTIKISARGVAALWMNQDLHSFMKWYEKSLSGPRIIVNQMDVASSLAKIDLCAALRMTCEASSFSDGFADWLTPAIKTPSDFRDAWGVLQSYSPKPGMLMIQDGYVDGRRDGKPQVSDLQQQLEKRWPEIDPTGWAEHIKSHPLSAKGYDLKIASDAPQLSAEADPNAAADLLIKAADKLPRAAALAQLTQAWAKVDVNATGAWLNRQNFDEDLIPALNVFARTALQTDPAAAFAWLEAIPDAAYRESSVTWLYEDWNRRDPASAGAWLTNANWSADRLRIVKELAMTRPLETR